jgi:hypothetical protein
MVDMANNSGCTVRVIVKLRPDQSFHPPSNQFYHIRWRRSSRSDAAAHHRKRETCAVATTKPRVRRPRAGRSIGCHASRPPFLPILGRNYLITGGVRADLRKMIQTRAAPRKRPEPAFLEKTSRNSGAACPIWQFQTSLPLSAHRMPLSLFRTHWRIVYLDVHVRRRHICAALWHGLKVIRTGF